MDQNKSQSSQLEKSAISNRNETGSFRRDLRIFNEDDEQLHTAGKKRITQNGPLHTLRLERNVDKNFSKERQEADYRKLTYFLTPWASCLGKAFIR